METMLMLVCIFGLPAAFGVGVAVTECWWRRLLLARGLAEWRLDDSDTPEFVWKDTKEGTDA